MSNLFVQFIIIIFLVAINGVFAMSEIALVSVRKARLQRKARNGDPAAIAALELSETPNRFLSTVQVGITLIGILSGALGGATIAEALAKLINNVPMLAEYSDGISLTLVVAMITYLQLVFGELIPKRIGLNTPERISIMVSRPMKVLSKIVAPIVNLLSASTELGLRMLGYKTDDSPMVTEEEVKLLLHQGTQIGIFEEVEQDLVESIFRLADRRVDAIMTPHTEIEWLNLDDPFEEIQQKIIDSPYSHFPIAQGNLDNIVGILLLKDFLLATRNGSQPDLKRLVIPPVFVPESMPALKVLESFKSSRNQLALVIDEYGGMLGIVTMFDILKSIVGNISQSGEKESEMAVERSDGSWLLDGKLPIDELKEMFSIEELPDEDRMGYQTLGGFIMSQLGKIPSEGNTYQWKKYLFEVIDMDANRVDKVMLAFNEEIIEQTGYIHPNENE
ncbi:MAG: HlyC/CorC family transporter [Anaerolineaceae bacterium]|nr:HlyC/CorC family transporter [Anaerolineaceae bacterium]